MIAGSFRFFAGYAIAYYMPSFFGAVYKDNQNLYSTLNAFVISVGGFISSYGGGIICDKYEEKSFMTKAYVSMIGTFLGCPAIAVCTLVQTSFGVSMGFLFIEYLVAESWTSPAITMLLNTISPENKGYGKH